MEPVTLLVFRRKKIDFGHFVFNEQLCSLLKTDYIRILLKQKNFHVSEAALQLRAVCKQIRIPRFKSLKENKQKRKEKK